MLRNLWHNHPNKTTGSALIDQFERFELSADLKGVSPREARLGRWILLYGILQVLSTLSVDVRDLKWTQGVRYFLCTDLKRCPEWVTNGQTEQMEASQLRSWCWQRPWAPTAYSGAPAELEGNSMPIGGELDSESRDVVYTATAPRAAPPAPVRSPTREPSGATLLNEDIRRISEKINDMHMSSSQTASHSPHRLYERRIENEKLKREDFDMTKRMDGSFRLTQSDYAYQRGGNNGMQPPLVPLRSPHRSPLRSPASSNSGHGNPVGNGPANGNGHGNGHGNGNGQGQGVRGWNEEAAGWV